MEAPKPIFQEISQIIIISQDSAKYPLNINSVGDIISFSLEYCSKNYSKKNNFERNKRQRIKYNICIFFKPSLY